MLLPEFPKKTKRKLKGDSATVSQILFLAFVRKLYQFDNFIALLLRPYRGLSIPQILRDRPYVIRK